MARFFFALLLLAGLLLIWLAFFGRTSLLYSKHRERLITTNIYPLAGEAKITQNFLAKYPGLYQIELYFQPRPDVTNDELIFYLRESCDASTDLETFIVQADSLVDGEPHPFVFEPIDASAGRQFCIVLEPASTGGEAVGVYGSNVDVYPDGRANFLGNTVERDERSPEEIRSSPSFSGPYRLWLPFVSKDAEASVPADFDIAFQLAYNGPVLETMKVLLARLAAEKPFPLGVPWFYAALFVLYLVCLIGLGVLIFTRKPGPKL